jgi:predicted acetyltransferase
MKVTILDKLGEDKEEVVDLLCKAFENSTLKNHFIDFINNVPYMKFILVRDEHRCVGVLCLLDRDIYIKYIPVKVTWMSYMAVDPNYKSFKITNLLKEALFQYSRKSSVLTVGIARKALDGYWYPYGFLGSTNFSEIYIDTSITPKIEADFIVRDFDRSDKVSLRLIELYNYTYTKVSGGVVRDKNIWKYHLQKIIKEGIELKYVIKDSIIIGYFLFKENKVLEVSGVDIFIKKSHQIINSYITCQNGDVNELIYEVGLSHPVFVYLTKYNHSVSQRFVWNGGHIVRIESVQSLLRLLLPTIEEKLIKIGVRDFEIFINNIKFSYKNKTLVLSKVDNINVEGINKQDWMKIILGIYDYKILNFINPNNEELIRLMFNDLNFQIPFLDHM